MADKKFKRFEKRLIPNKMGGMDTVMVPRDLTLEEKIVEKIRERAPKKKMGGGMMKKPMGYTDGGITFKEYLEGRGKEERRRGRQKLLDDFEEFKRRRKVLEQKQMAKSGKMIKKPMSYDKGGMGEDTSDSFLDKPTGRRKKKKSGGDEASNRKPIRRIKFDDVGDRKTKDPGGMERIGRAGNKKQRLMPIGIMPRQEKDTMQGMSKGGMCRGMGAAVRGGSFKGVK